MTGKDVIVTLCGAFNSDEVLNHAVEFAGPGVASLSIDERLVRGHGVWGRGLEEFEHG